MEIQNQNMRCSNCGICCEETEMLLTEKDIVRLVRKGFNRKHFIKYSADGYVQLKNQDGYCVFYDLKNHQCKVYVDRPWGCRVYPVIFDEDKGIVLDDICKSRKTISEKEMVSKGRRVIKLLAKIDEEAASRLS